MKIKGLLDQVSLKQFGVPEKFENMFNDIYRGEDGGIYIALPSETSDQEIVTMHLLSKKGKAYPIRHAPEAPADIIELHHKLYTPTKAGKRLRTAVGTAYQTNENAHLQFLIEEKYQSAVPGMVPDDYSFEETYEYHLFSKKFSASCYGAVPTEKNNKSIRALFATGCLLIARKDCYEIVDFVPIFEDAHGKTIFWAGGRELILAYLSDGRLYFRLLGSLMKFTQTKVGALLEIKDKEKYILYHLGKKLELVAYANFENGFVIDENTGKVVCYSSYNCDGMVESTKTYVFENGKYKEVQ